MNRKINNKLRSRRGASITFALLLFLVCAVLCVVIVTAASAAAGRISRIAETDQRYYVVTSAAELMVDMIDGKAVTVVEKDGKTYLFETGEDIAATAYTEASQIDGEDAAGTALLNSLPNRIAYALFQGTAPENGTLTLSSTDITGFPEVTIDETFDGSTLTLTVHNTSGSAYTLILEFNVGKVELSSYPKLTKTYYNLNRIRAIG